MAKSKPTGLRYDLELYYVATLEHSIKTPQQWFNYLEREYIESRSIKNVQGFLDAFISTVEDKPVGKTEGQSNKNETILIRKEMPLGLDKGGKLKWMRENQ